MARVFLFDVSICNGCHNCQIVCKDEFVGNDWPGYSLSQPDTGQFWMKVTDKIRGTVPKVKQANTPVMCNHCDDAPCIKASTNGAIYKRSDGLVIIDPVLSAGQQQLVAACPYGEIYWNESLNIPQKCTGCAHILDAASSQTDPGLMVPRCVDACPTGALTLGDDTDPVTQAFMAQAEVLHPEYATKPRVYYQNLPTFFIAGALADPVADECIEGATVTATDVTTGQIYTTQSDNYGDFWFEGMELGKSYELSISATGYMTEKRIIFVNNDVNAGDINLFAQ